MVFFSLQNLSTNDAFSLYSDVQQHAMAFNLASLIGYMCRCGTDYGQFSRYTHHIAVEMNWVSVGVEYLHSGVKVYFRDRKTKRYICPHPNCVDIGDFNSDDMNDHLRNVHKLTSEKKNFATRKLFYELIVKKKAEIECEKQKKKAEFEMKNKLKAAGIKSTNAK